MRLRVAILLCLGASLQAAELSITDRYLTAIAERLWAARDARVASLRTAAEIEERQRFVRAKIAELMGGFPQRTPLNARVTGTLDRDGYRVEKLIYESRPKFYVTADLYVPTSGHARYPAVLGVAGHSETSKAEPLYQRGWISMAKRGYIVLAFDPPGQGERSQFWDAELGKSRLGIGTPEHTNVGLQCILTGSSLADYEVWDGIRAVDYLLTRPDVDPKRLAVAGNSGGGTQSAYLAALEPRLAVAAPSCFLTSSERLWKDLGPQDAEQNIVGFLAAGLDLKDFAFAFAPRPFQFLTATRDFFPIAGAHDAYAEARRIYEVLGHTERVNFFEYNDTHGWSQPRREATYRWFQKWLNDQPLDQGAETQFDVEPAANLTATADGQVTSSLGGETVQSLNAQLAERLAKNRPKLSGDALRRDILARLGITALHMPVQEGTSDPYRSYKIVTNGSASTARQPAIIFLNPRNPNDPDTNVLANTGHVVLVPVLRGWEGTIAKGPGRPPHTPLYTTSMRAMLVGRTIAGMQVSDLLAAFDTLASMPQVDPKRISVFAKGSATVAALYAAVLEPGIHKVICEGGPVSYLEIARARFHDEISDLVVPGVLKDFDLPDLAAAIAPRAVWIADPRTPSGGLERLEKASAAYKSAAGFRIMQRSGGWSVLKVYEGWLAQ